VESAPYRGLRRSNGATLSLPDRDYRQRLALFAPQKLPKQRMVLRLQSVKLDAGSEHPAVFAAIVPRPPGWEDSGISSANASFEPRANALGLYSTNGKTAPTRSCSRRSTIGCGAGNEINGRHRIRSDPAIRRSPSLRSQPLFQRDREISRVGQSCSCRGASIHVSDCRSIVSSQESARRQLPPRVHPVIDTLSRRRRRYR
jgi:hypothetical protein